MTIIHDSLDEDSVERAGNADLFVVLIDDPRFPLPRNIEEIEAARQRGCPVMVCRVAGCMEPKGLLDGMPIIVELAAPTLPEGILLIKAAIEDLMEEVAEWVQKNKPGWLEGQADGR